MADVTHSITLKIAGKEYSLVAKPESEHYMRMAAENINAMLASYDQRFPNATDYDKLAFVALSQTISMLASKRSLEKNLEEYTQLEKELKSYLSKIEVNR